MISDSESYDYHDKITARLWHYLHQEFYLKPDSAEYSSWISFIQEKDLGIIIAKVKEQHFIYQVIDEKKWLLTKLKYSL